MNGCFMLHNSNTKVCDYYCWWCCFLGLRHEGNLFPLQMNVFLYHLSTWRLDRGLGSFCQRGHRESMENQRVSQRYLKETQNQQEGCPEDGDTLFSLLHGFKSHSFCRRSFAKPSWSSGKITRITDNVINQSGRGGGPRLGPIRQLMDVAGD